VQSSTALGKHTTTYSAETGLTELPGTSLVPSCSLCSHHLSFASPTGILIPTYKMKPKTPRLARTPRFNRISDVVIADYKRLQLNRKSLSFTALTDRHLSVTYCHGHLCRNFCVHYSLGGDMRYVVTRKSGWLLGIAGNLGQSK